LTPFRGTVKTFYLEARVSQPTERAVETGGDDSYDALVARLERVVGELESGKLNLEQSIEKFAEGVQLAKDASRKLDEAEKRVEMLVRGADGGDEAVPFTPDAGKGS
jgi:exodeoxyribonuclease VII small subunit